VTPTSSGLVLASSSPRRLALLRRVGVEPDAVVPPEVDETVRAGELPRDYARRLAGTKARAVHARVPDRHVLAADTVVACGRRILDQTEDEAQARRALALLSGRRHRVWTAVAVAPPDGGARIKTAMTQVRFKRLTRDEIDAYLASGEWRGKAGAYAIQGRAEAFVLQLNGSYSNVVGLPTAVALALLRGTGWRAA
jgi:septum formation protein